jgi:hypothetical protein
MFGRARRTSLRPPRLRRILGAGLDLLEARSLLAAVPLNATAADSAEYMLGDVNVSVVFLESSTASQNTETWTPAVTDRVKNTIQTGLQWWEDTLHAYHPDAYLNFHIDFTYADNPFVVGFEPINNTSDQHTQFVDSFLSSQGFTTGTRDEKIYAFNNAQRIAKQTNWSYTIFVVNDENDKAADGTGDFAVGGAFQQSFAFPGGRYIVTLSDRPAEIIAHETGHIFWAFDEYPSGDTYSQSRGYFNTQNLNGANGAPPGFSQQNSIMSSGDRLTQSYLQHTLPVSTRNLIGWRDSDNDGLLDVLDVPFTLTGDGYRDAAGNYRFVGSSKVQALPNRNTVGTKDDLSINRIRVAEYSFDGVNWTTAATFDTYSANLDLTIPLAGQTQISIRTRDTETGATSAVFTGSTSRLNSTLQAGINGFVFNDLNSNGVWDSTEPTLSGRSVQLVNSSGQPLSGPVVLEPNNYAHNQLINDAIPEVSLSVVGTNASITQVLARDASFGTGYSTRAFAGYDKNSILNAFWTGGKQLRMDFQTPVRQISLDAIGALTAGSYARLDAYDAAGNILARYTTSKMSLGTVETMTVSSSTADIAYAIAYGHASTNVGLDHLQIGAQVTTTTDAFGAYALPNLLGGTYYVKIAAPTDWTSTNPATGIQQVAFATGQTLADANFGQHSTLVPWQNSENRFDVDADHRITPLDALLVIIDLNATGPRQLNNPPSAGDPPRFIDVNGDGMLTPLDALAVIIRLNSGGNGEPPTTSGSSGGEATPPGVAPAGEPLAHLTEAAFSSVVSLALLTKSEALAAPQLPLAGAATPPISSTSIVARSTVATLNAAAGNVPASYGATRLRAADSAIDLALPLARKVSRDPSGAAPRAASKSWQPFSPELNEAELDRLAADVAAARGRKEEAAPESASDSSAAPTSPSMPDRAEASAAPPAGE